MNTTDDLTPDQLDHFEEFRAAFEKGSRRGPTVRHISPEEFEDACDHFEERAAIRQYDGGQSREAAEKGALDDVKRKRNAQVDKRNSDV